MTWLLYHIARTVTPQPQRSHTPHINRKRTTTRALLSPATTSPYRQLNATPNIMPVMETFEDFSGRQSCGSIRKKINDDAKYNSSVPAEEGTSQGRNLKRARRIKTFHNELLGNCLEKNRSWGLKDLFAGHRTPFTTSAKDPFPMLRMEHREGGTTAKHMGEERILLFRDDCPGAIAKIIYSSVAVADQSTADPENRARIAQAKVHVLNVKEPYRGYDLGGLLFTEAVASLKHRYRNEYEGVNENDHDAFIHCQLDAEEDSRRYSKLVRFYESLGCDIKSQAKIQYMACQEATERPELSEHDCDHLWFHHFASMAEKYGICG